MHTNIEESIFGQEIYLQGEFNLGPNVPYPLQLEMTCKNTQHSNNIVANTYYKTQLQCTLHTMPTQKVQE